VDRLVRLGGRRNDLETLRRAVPILRSDYVFDPISEQNHIYGISFWMPYHGSGIEQIDQYWTRSLMGPIVGFGVDTRKTGWNYDLLRKLYAQTRQVQRCYLGDYYPLTPYRADAGAWNAYQFDLPEHGEGIVHAFRRKMCPTRPSRSSSAELSPTRATWSRTSTPRKGARCRDGSCSRPALTSRQPIRIRR